jgi:signal transduction histidine kinase
MRDPSHAFRRRSAGLAVLLLAGVVTCVTLAFLMTRRSNRTLQRLASVELEAARQARDFRAAVDDLHGALLRIGYEPASDTLATIEQRRRRLTEWLSHRQRAARIPGESELLQRLAEELRLYFRKLDEIAVRSDHYVTPLDREMIVVCDDAAVRLQSRADEFAALHDAGLRELLDASLGSVQWLRNLVFLCLALLALAITTVVVLLYRDIVRPLRAQLIENERLLAQREKLAALGTLAAGVAHEIRNPLTAVKARLYTLRRLQTNPEAVRDADSIRSEVERLERIVRDVLGYAHPAAPRLDALDLGAWLKEFGAFMQAEIRARNIELAIDGAATAPVRADADQLRQIMLNLVRNAEEAFEGRPGRIALAVRRERGTLRGEAAEIAVLSVTDDGPGIPANIQPRLFDPFFTTKSNGTGLGLSIVGRLVENQGGEIVFQTAPRAGTRFSVRLPIAAMDAYSSAQ